MSLANKPETALSMNSANHALTDRRAAFDLLKCLAAFLVICIHAPWPGTVGACFLPITRCAVPIFLMISGYYFVWNDSERQARQLARLLAITVEANVLYIPWMLLFAELRGDGAFEHILHLLSLERAFEFLILNESPFGYHLWYLGAVLYVVALFALLARRGYDKHLFILAPILFLGNLVLDAYAPFFFERDFSSLLTRNFLFLGIPCFCLGAFFRRHAAFFEQKLKTSHLIAAICLSGVGLILEGAWLSSMERAKHHAEFYLFALPLAGALFCLAAKNANAGQNTVFQKIGQNLALYIYILHPMVNAILKQMATLTGASAVYHSVAPLIVFAVTAALAAFLKRISTKIQFGFSAPFMEKCLQRLGAIKTVA